MNQAVFRDLRLIFFAGYAKFYKTTQVRNMTKDKKVFSVEEALTSMLNKSGLTDKSEYIKIYKVWPSVVGEKIAENTCLESVNRGTLLVNVSNPAWMQELHFLKDMIIEKLEKELGAGQVKDVRFKTGRVPERGSGKIDLSDVELSDDETKKTEKESAGIKDPDVREAFQHLMETHLKSKKED